MDFLHQVLIALGWTPPATTPTPPPAKNPTAGFKGPPPAFVAWWKDNADSFRGPAGLVKAQALEAGYLAGDPTATWQWIALASMLTTEYPNPAYTGRDGITATLPPLYQTDPDYAWWGTLGTPSVATR